MVQTTNPVVEQKNQNDKPRTVKRVANSIATTEGEGFLVHRSFPTRAVSDFDPFMLLDEMGPMDLAPGEAKGAPDHPHRGFETVTYMLDGKFEHKDSQGHHGKLAAGDVQWMTAGSGVVHSEMPEKEFALSGGRLHGFQLWVNLPKRDKMMEPRYQDIPKAKIPLVESADGKTKIRVIAGESLGKQAVIETRTPMMYLHVTVQPGGELRQQIPPSYNVFAYVVGGSGTVGSASVAREQSVLFNNDGGHVSIKVPESNPAPFDVLLIGGIPLNEPVARYGPFVMNTEDEIYQAMEDYRNGKMGRISH